MAAVIVVTCPQCQKQLKAPAELQGKKIRCKCGTAFAVPAAAANKPAEPKETFGLLEDDAPQAKPKKAAPPPPKPAPPKKKKDDDDDEDSSPYGVTTQEFTARCPNCAKEMESEEAVICLNCGYNTRTRVRASTKRVHEITSQDRVGWLMPAIATVVLVLILLGANLGVWFGMEETWKGWDEAAGTQSLSRGVRTWMSAFSAWIGWIGVKFAFRRLVLDPTPPEVEIKEGINK